MLIRKFFSVVLFVFAIATPLVGFEILLWLGNPQIFEDTAFANVWIILPFAVIPLASLVFGIVITAKGGRAKKNIIAGSISLFITLIMGLLSLQNQPDRSGKFLREATQVTRISFPQHVDAASRILQEGGRLGDAQIKDSEESKLFWESVCMDNRWTNELPYVCQGILPYTIEIKFHGFDKYCFCLSPSSLSNEQVIYNPTVIGDGSYWLTLVGYRSSMSHIRIFDSYQLLVK